jgi:hypothetical protein
MIEWLVSMRLWIGFREDYLYTIFYATSHALRMQTTAKLLGSPDPIIFYFPLKLIGADHGLYTSGDV